MFSLVLPFYNEEACLKEVVNALVSEKRNQQLPIEFVLVDNGSLDGTRAILNQLKKKFPEVRLVLVDRNRGYGYGIRQGLTTCHTPYLGFMSGDGQTDTRDVTRVVREITHDSQLDICKVVRRKRNDGVKRRIISIIYNWLFALIFLLPMKDVNGTPKIFKYTAYEKLKLTANDWFIDAEIILKAKLYDLTLKEIPTEHYKRKTGSSSVNQMTLFEFLKNLFIYRMKLPLTLSLNKRRWNI